MKTLFVQSNRDYVPSSKYNKFFLKKKKVTIINSSKKMLIY